MSPLTILLVCFATYRLSRLVTADFITQPIRSWAERKNETLGYLFSCDWCFSVYVATVLTTVTMIWPDNRVWLGVLIGLTASMTAGLLATLEGLMDRTSTVMKHEADEATDA